MNFQCEFIKIINGVLMAGYGPMTAVAGKMGRFHCWVSRPVDIGSMIHNIKTACELAIALEYIHCDVATVE